MSIWVNLYFEINIFLYIFNVSFSTDNNHI